MVALDLGQIVATPGALQALSDANQLPGQYLERHEAGDWGEIVPEDWKGNDDSVKEGAGAQSVYTLSTGVQIWIITESDRSVTTILLPEEY
jgi:hypothetical protein